ncbi:unnamed protein product [Mytilus coruscus]|uniref:Uncharacterized protein n=1 Tax=Mytilus coruscus TaxID=42192 RepID=A0A6J8A216_MYTCO|nr:unnamed protein product [Mytilus coruscus]
MSMLTLLLVSLVGSVVAYDKLGPLLGGLGSSGVVTSSGGALIGGGRLIGGGDGIVSDSRLLINIGGIGLVGGGQPWCSCSLKCAQGQIKLNKNCNLAPLLPVSLVGSVSAYGKVGPLLGGLGSSGVVTGGALIGGGGVIGGAGGIVSGSGLLINNGGLGGLGGVIGGLNTGLVGGGRPWCTCSLKCGLGQIKLNKNCNLAPLLPGSLNTCCSLLPYGVSLGGAGIIGGGGIIGGVSGILGGGSGLLGPIGGIGGPIGGVVTGPVSVIGGSSKVVSGPIGKGGYY